jgi:hypothetical protein
MQQLPECRFITDKLRAELSPTLFYHNIEHTLDVCERASEIGKQEQLSESDSKLLAIAAAYHDSGFLFQSDNHEHFSCEMVRQYLPQYNYSSTDIETICAIIMATKIPQNPKTHLEEILCDADLDYFGRADFSEIAERLYAELMANGSLISREEWNYIQYKFISTHNYFTATSITLRQAAKERNLKRIKQV